MDAANGGAGSRGSSGSTCCLISDLDRCDGRAGPLRTGRVGAIELTQIGVSPLTMVGASFTLVGAKGAIAFARGHSRRFLRKLADAAGRGNGTDAGPHD